jgi:hypothetical protein
MSEIKLTVDDYYRYSAPFRQWLFENKNKNLTDYNTDEAKFLFKNEFCTSWNKNQLNGIWLFFIYLRYKLLVYFFVNAA